MDIQATAKYVRISPRKLRPIVDVVRGKKVEEALVILSLLPSPSARTLAKVVKSAAANAENNFEMTPSELRIVRIYVNGGRSMKRFRAGERGRAKQIIKSSIHITVTVKE